MTTEAVMRARDQVMVKGMYPPSPQGTPLLARRLRLCDLMQMPRHDVLRCMHARMATGVVGDWI